MPEYVTLCEQAGKPQDIVVDGEAGTGFQDIAQLYGPTRRGMTGPHGVVIRPAHGQRRARRRMVPRHWNTLDMGQQI